MANNKLTTPPSIVEALYKGHSVPEIIAIYTTELNTYGTVESIAHATSLLSYQSTAISIKHLSKIRTLFNKMFNVLYKSVDFDFTMEARRKSLLSTDNKILKLQSDHKSLDLLRDFLGFRIIIYGKKSEEKLTLDCYRLMQILIEFCSKSGYTLCDADTPKNISDFKPENFPNIIVPNEHSVSKIFKYWYGIKDYIQHPKENGYQSLHAVFRDDDGKFFEIQIRTLNQHINAEASAANHNDFKNKTYRKIKKENTVDFTKLNIPGFSLGPNGEIFDYVGLTKSLLIFHRQKTF